MKKLLILLVVVFFLAGCASTLSIKSADGVSMTLKDYVVTETYGAGGKVTSRTMVPAADIISGMMTKMMDALKSAMGFTGDAAKIVVPAVTK